jgi:hypothetical protein
VRTGFLKTLLDSHRMDGLGLVLTTTNKVRLDEAVGADTKALEVVGKPYDLGQINAAIGAAMAQVEGRRTTSRAKAAVACE